MWKEIFNTKIKSLSLVATSVILLMNTILQISPTSQPAVVNRLLIYSYKQSTREHDQESQHLSLIQASNENHQLSHQSPNKHINSNQNSITDLSSINIRCEW